MVEQNEQQAFELYRKAAELGHYQAMNTLALYYLNGKGGIPKNPQLAISWLTKTAEQEDAYAQNLLGMGYLYGLGNIPQDLQLGAQWTLRAARQGVPEAQSRAGSMYFTGMGVEKNMKKAVSWWEKAVAQGEKRAQFSLGLCLIDEMESERIRKEESN